MNRNLGQTSLRRKNRSGKSMSEFDDLPAPLRGWLSKAALPWSVVSARRIWSKCLAKGLTVDDALQSLTNAENKTLARDRVSNF